MSAMRIKELLEYGRNNLINKDAPFMVSKIVLKHLLNVDDTYILIHNKDEVEEMICVQFKKNIELLNEGTPVQYITKKQEFMKLDFYVDENVLIPQPDTEILVEEVIELCKNKDGIKILDLCTGSGAIGVSLAKYIKDSKVTMTDISDMVLEIAKKNAIKNNVIDKCSFLQSDMFEKMEEKVDYIVSNPPYIETDTIYTLGKEVQKEPKLALDGGKDGLDFYKIIVQNAWKYLKENGTLALEIGYNQKEAVIKLLEDTKKYKNIYGKKDLSGNDRIIIAKVRSN